MSRKKKLFRTKPVLAKHDKYNRFAGENPYDPVQRVIDWQFAIPWAGGWYDRIPRDSRTYISPTVSRGSSAIQKKNDIEDRLLGAIEWKQLRKIRNWKIFKMYLDGYPQEEVANTFQLSKRQIRRIIKNF